MFTPIKRLGQNFLTDREIARQMVQALEVTHNDVVVEIGAGLGILTHELSEKYAGYPDFTVHALDIDKRFTENLKNTFLRHPNFNIIEADVLEWLPHYLAEKPFKILSSLPYYITSPILHALIKMQRPPELCVLLMQKEVAQKINAQAPDSSYMSAFVQTFYDVTYLQTVDRKKFTPAPSVDGGVLVWKRKSNVEITGEQIRRYEGFLHKGYANPRKMLNKVFNAQELAKLSIDGNLRPQNLSAQQWLDAFKLLVQVPQVI